MGGGGAAESRRRGSSDGHFGSCVDPNAFGRTANRSVIWAPERRCHASCCDSESAWFGVVRPVPRPASAITMTLTPMRLSANRSFVLLMFSILMRDSDRARNLGLVPLSVVGVGLFVVGAWFRKKCYQAIGQLV